MTAADLSSYAELIGIIEALPVLVREKRRRLSLGLRAAADQSGVGMSTISRFENGENLSQDGLVALLRWVGTPDAAPEPDPQAEESAS